MQILQWVCLLLTVVGFVVTAITAVRYRRFVLYLRDESYREERASDHFFESMGQLSMLFFMVGFVVGAIDLIRRPVESIYLFVVIVFFVGALFLASLVRMQFAQAVLLRDKTTEVMRAFVNSVEKKDPYTKGHSWHVYTISHAFYEALPPPLHARVNGPKLFDAAMLHDIGKVGVDNHILNKPAPLTEAEWVQVRSHPRLGEEMLADTSFSEIGEWVLYHHERIDGQGYYRLPGEELPLEARMLAIADTYSAITTDRSYREKCNHEEALEILRSAAGTQLDAALVDCFCTIDQEKLAEDAPGPPVCQGQATAE